MEATTITVEMPIQLYQQLQLLAEDECAKPMEVLSRLVKVAVQRRAQPATRAFQRILERATDLGVDDLAEHHDHYLYGVDTE